MTKQEQAAVKHQVPRVLLIAAVIVLVLAGTALAMAFPGIQEWFGRQWAEETGKLIEKDQMGIITGLTDEVGVSAESGGVTITVDSITRGREALWMLLKIDGVPSEEELEAQLSRYEHPIEGLPEGITPPSTRYYSFWDMNLELTPGIESAFTVWGTLQESRGEDGSLTLLMRYNAPASLECTPLDAEEMTLRLEHLQWGGLTGQVPIAEGTWELTCSLPVIESQEALTTGPCRLPAYLFTPGGWDSATMGSHSSEEVDFRDIRVTSTGAALFWADPEQAERTYMGGRWCFLVMKDGTELELETGGQEYDKLSDGTVVTQKSWPVPVDLSQAKALRYRQEGKDYILELK